MLCYNVHCVVCLVHVNRNIAFGSHIWNAATSMATVRIILAGRCDDPPLRSTYVKVCHITASGEPRPDTSAVRRRVVRNSSRPSRVAWRQYLARHLGPGLASNDPDLWSKLCLKIVYKGNGIRFGTFGRMICWTRRDWSIQLL
jgi:hypothetical protein